MVWELKNDVKVVESGVWCVFWMVLMVWGVIWVMMLVLVKLMRDVNVCVVRCFCVGVRVLECKYVLLLCVFFLLFLCVFWWMIKYCDVCFMRCFFVLMLFCNVCKSVLLVVNLR